MKDPEGEAMKDLAHAVEAHGGVQQMLALFPSDLARVAILTMTSFLPQLNTPALSDDTLAQLRALPRSAGVPEYGPLLECLFAWGRGDEAMALICDGMDAAIGNKPSAKAKKAGAVEPMAAVHYLEYLLENHRTRAWLLAQVAEGNATVSRLLTTMDQSPAKLVAALEGAEGGEELLESTQAVFLASCRLKLHRDSTAPTKDLALVLEAVRASVLPELLGAASEEAPAKKGRKQRKTKETAKTAGADSLKQDVCVDLAKLCTEVVTLGMDRELVLVRHMMGWMDTIKPEALRSTSPVTGALMPMFYKLSFQLSLRAWDEPALTSTFTKVFGALLKMTPASLLKGTGDGWSVKGCLAEMLKAAKQRKANLSILLKVFLASLPAVEEPAESADDLSNLNHVVLSVLAKSPAAVHCLPTVLDTMVSAQGSTDDRLKLSNVAAQALTGLCYIAPLEVKNTKGRKEFLVCMKQCASTLELLNAEGQAHPAGYCSKLAQQRVAMSDAVMGEEEGEEEPVLDDALFTEGLMGCLRGLEALSVER
jgi:hypothetical protein